MISRLSRIDPWYVTGFIDGEGCFCLTVNTERKKRARKISVYRYWIVDFSIHLRSDDKLILIEIRDFLGGGRVNLIRKGRGQQEVHLSVRDRGVITSRLIPHLEQYPLQAKKKADFQLWREAVGILDAAQARRKSRFDGQQINQDEEERLLVIRDKLAEQRLRGKNLMEYRSIKRAVRPGKTIFEMS